MRPCTQQRPEGVAGCGSLTVGQLGGVDADQTHLDDLAVDDELERVAVDLPRDRHRRPLVIGTGSQVGCDRSSRCRRRSCRPCMHRSTTTQAATAASAAHRRDGDGRRCRGSSMAPTTVSGRVRLRPASRRRLLPPGPDGRLAPAAPVAELADAQGLGPCERKLVWVRFPPGARGRPGPAGRS